MEAAGLVPQCQGARLPLRGGAGHAADLTAGRPGQPLGGLVIVGLVRDAAAVSLEDALVLEVGLFVALGDFLQLFENLVKKMYFRGKRVGNLLYLLLSSFQFGGSGGEWPRIGTMMGKKREQCQDAPATLSRGQTNGYAIAPSNEEWVGISQKGWPATSYGLLSGASDHSGLASLLRYIPHPSPW